MLTRSDKGDSHISSIDDYQMPEDLDLCDMLELSKFSNIRTPKQQFNNTAETLKYNDNFKTLFMS